jgi:hypothetical protein
LDGVRKLGSVGSFFAFHLDLFFHQLPATVQEVGKSPDLPCRWGSEFGTDECWELDALAPNVVTALIRREVDQMVDERARAKAVRKEQKSKRLLGAWASEIGQ